VTLADLRWPLERAARVHGGSPAVTSAGRSLTYAELASRVALLGAALAGLGVEPGERVAFLGVNSLAHLECWLGAARTALARRGSPRQLTARGIKRQPCLRLMPSWAPERRQASF
jgi:acyl-CoA synthetase (AMP-forming)/AMP-acid ligase II